MKIYHMEVINLSFVMLNAVMLSVVMLSVLAFISPYTNHFLLGTSLPSTLAEIRKFLLKNHKLVREKSNHNYSFQIKFFSGGIRSFFIASSGVLLCYNFSVLKKYFLCFINFIRNKGMELVKLCSAT
jgi:hypothetical protein